MGTGASAITSGGGGRRSTGVQTDDWQPLLEASAASPLVVKVSTGVLSGSPPPHEAQRRAKPSIEDTWHAVCQTLDVPMGEENNNSSLVVRRTGWKTIRIFVSSTFKDFQDERELLVKEIFPDIRAWCEERRLHLVECDLRWGIPKDSTTELTLRTCLGEIDRCYQDNVMPFFLNMTSERIGWIPEHGEVPQNLVDEYRWVFGLSVTEMEIVHGAYRKDNPNSLFMSRDDSFLETLPEAHRQIFIDENPIAPAKLELLRKMIKDRFPHNRVKSYGCQFTGEDPVTHSVKLQLDSNFRESVMEFFKERIELQYPLLEVEEDPFVRIKEAHESFLKSRSDTVLGRADVLAEVRRYVDGMGGDTPALIIGGSGSGKSSILAKAADDTLARALDQTIPGGRDWHVFYHFVGAVPGSTDLLTMLQRLLKEIKVVDDTSMPADLESVVQMTCSALNNPSGRPVVVLLDALNQLDEDGPAQSMTWVPRKLAPQVRCVFAMTRDTPQHTNLMSRESKPREIHVSPLSLSIRKDMVTEYLGKFNKRLDMDQMITLLSKESSQNPLWLSIACEELRVFGQFRQISDKINRLADGLLGLLQQVLSRFEEEGGGRLLVATLCLIEVSLTGLLEAELLNILADEDNLMPPKSGAEKGEKETIEKETFKMAGQLPAFKWSTVYRSLRPFLRPFGNSGEGRLDFYHRSLSEAVRKKYLKTEGQESGNERYKWWHQKLASFFNYSDNFDRKAEEYPHHLIKLKDSARLETFLGHWEAFDRLFDPDLSHKLLLYWRSCGGNDRMLVCYSEKLQDLKADGANDEVLARRYEQVGRVLLQAGIYDQALELTNQALEIEEQKLNGRPEKMASLYGLIANIWDAKTKLHAFVAAEQIPQQKEVIRFCEKAIAIFATLPGPINKRKLGLQYIKLAFALAGLADCGGGPECLVQGNETVAKAVTIFTQLNDPGTLAEAVMTQAVLCRGSMETQMKFYKEALDLCIQGNGYFHVLTGRIYFNMAICYEDNRNFDKAYDLFKLNYLIKVQVYGKEHIKTVKSREVFNEARYKAIRERRNDTDFH